MVDGAIDAPDLHAGDVVALDGMRVTVQATDGRGPTRVEFRFDRPLDDPDLRFLTWHDGRFEPVAPPPIGGTLVL